MFERICIILLANFLYFGKSLGYRYCSDDIPASRVPKNPVKWKHWISTVKGCDRHSTQVDHLITMIIHSLVCVFIYLAFGATDISFLAAFLFMVNPVNNQGAIWISGRGYAMPTLGILMSIVLPVLAPALLWVTTYYNHGFVSSIVLLFSPVPWVAAFLPFCWASHYIRMKKNVKAKIAQEMFKEDKTFGWHKIVLAIKTFGFYLVHSLVPIKTTFYHSFIQSAAGSGKEKAYTWKDRFFFIGVIAVVAILARLTLVKWDMINYGLLWFCIGIAPFCNLFRMQQEIAERYCYLPGAGLMLALACVLVGHPVAIAAILAMYATKLWFYMDCYQDDYYLTEQASLHSPDSWFAWHVRALKRWDAKSHQEAVIFWVMAKNISPKEFKLNFNLANALMLAGHPGEAQKFITVAEENIPGGQESQAAELIKLYKSGKFGVIT